MLQFVRQLVDGRHIDSAAHLGVVHELTHQPLGLTMDLLGNHDFFGERNMRPQAWRQFTRLLQGRLVPTIHVGGRFRVLGIEAF